MYFACLMTAYTSAFSRLFVAESTRVF